MLDKAAVIKMAEQYADAVINEFSPSAVILFGSHEQGNARDDSDIDIGVVFDGFKEDRQKAYLRLWNLAYDISWDIEPHLLDTTKDRSGFAKHIIKTGRIIYQA